MLREKNNIDLVIRKPSFWLTSDDVRENSQFR